MISKEDIEVLTSLGLTPLQAKVYLATVNLDDATIQKISERTQVARQQIYTVAKDLEEIGLVEKIVGRSLKLNNIPISDAVSILLQREYRKRVEAEQKALDLTKRYEHRSKIKTKEIETQNAFLLIPGGEALSLKLKKLVNSVQKSIDILLPKKTCLQALFALSSNFVDALDRSVRMRCIVDEQIVLNSMPAAITKIIENPQFKLKVVLTPCTETLGIYDKKTVIFGCQSRRDYARTEALWTTNVPLVRIIQHYFDDMWNLAVHAQHFASSKMISLGE
jgi:sugar-specific transcriptional regulator TrmB